MFDDRLDPTAHESEVQAWRDRHPAYPSYLAQGGPRREPNRITGEGAANSIAFVNSALTSGGDTDHDRINAVFATVEVTFPDKNNPDSTIHIGETAMILLDNIADPDHNPYGIVLADYGDDYEFHGIKQEDTDI
jgi:hypothetical protein